MGETLNYFSQLPLLELIAVVMSLLYVVLAAKGNIWCWPAALVSTVLYTAIFYDVYLWMDSLLQIYYLVMAVYGWYCWRNVHIDNISNKSTNKAVSTQTFAIKVWTMQTHFYIVIFLSMVSYLVGWLMANYTPADFPYFDAATTVFAVFATYMVAKKILENWIYWVFIDFVSIYIYLEKGLTPTAVLFGLYVVLAGYGYYQWHKRYQGQQALIAPSL